MLALRRVQTFCQTRPGRRADKTATCRAAVTPLQSWAGGLRGMSLHRCYDGTRQHAVDTRGCL